MSNLISRIELVSRPKKIYRVLFDNDFQIELVEDTLLSFNLAKGSSIPDDTLYALQHYDAVMVIFGMDALVEHIMADVSPDKNAASN